MSAGEASGAGRRLTPAEAERGRQLFAEGRSEREVAAALHVGRGTAHRLRERLAAEAEFGQALAESAELPRNKAAEQAARSSAPSFRDGSAGDNDPGETGMTGHDDQAPEMTPPPPAGDAAELDQLAGQREALGAEVITQAERAESSLQAVAALEAERISGLAEGRDVQGLRERRRNADDDARDFADAARIARGRLDAADKQIAAVKARIADARLRAELDEAIGAMTGFYAGLDERRVAAVLAPRKAAEDLVASYAEEAAVTGRVNELRARLGLAGPLPDVPPPPSRLWFSPSDYVSGEATGLMRALNQARAGNVKAVCQELGVANGFLPVSREDRAAEAERMRALYADQPQPARPAQQVVMDPNRGASYGVDRHGSPLPPPPPATPDRPRPQQVVRPGSLGFQPFPR